MGQSKTVIWRSSFGPALSNWSHPAPMEPPANLIISVVCTQFCVQTTEICVQTTEICKERGSLSRTSLLIPNTNSYSWSLDYFIPIHACQITEIYKLTEHVQTFVQITSARSERCSIFSSGGSSLPYFSLDFFPSPLLSLVMLTSSLARRAPPLFWNLEINPNMKRNKSRLNYIVTTCFHSSMTHLFSLLFSLCLSRRMFYCVTQPLCHDHRGSRDPAVGSVTRQSWP